MNIQARFGALKKSDETRARLRTLRTAIALVILTLTFASCSKASEGPVPGDTGITPVPPTAALKAPIVTFIELGSVNCVPCKAMQPVMESIRTEYPDQVNVVFYDVWTDKGAPYGRQYKIRAIPTQVFLDKDGKEYFRHEGFFPKEELVEILQQGGIKL